MGGAIVPQQSEALSRPMAVRWVCGCRGGGRWVPAAEARQHARGTGRDGRRDSRGYGAPWGGAGFSFPLCTYFLVAIFRLRRGVGRIGKTCNCLTRTHRHPGCSSSKAEGGEREGGRIQNERPNPARPPSTSGRTGTRNRIGTTRNQGNFNSATLVQLHSFG